MERDPSFSFAPPRLGEDSLAGWPGGGMNNVDAVGRGVTGRLVAAAGWLAGREEAYRAAAEVVAVAVATLLGSVEGVSVGKEEGCGVGWGGRQS
ncbi:hypothetical protein ZWY2020_049764 [Hordeum vulgare]|nr:hypothetical protein ZWY2020_049764 [Hordeum vulgare]